MKIKLHIIINSSCFTVVYVLIFFWIKSERFNTNVQQTGEKQ